MKWGSLNIDQVHRNVISILACIPMVTSAKLFDKSYPNTVYKVPVVSVTLNETRSKTHCACQK